ncbi:hypothetical protein F5887DRAFT_1283008 [Amanita rubescens]|nr:hypothetical protein F5887DRAFT_1285187 [Amanita rubescens]KAF8345033.1 hypothetical protein F5887DRAFT_1283008 [Amanita rubescens]
MTYLDTTLGATFVGNVIAGCLYGIASIQAYTYFRRRPTDSIIFRSLLFLVWLADTTQLIFVTHALYYYMVINYDNPLALLYPNWSILSQVFATCISGFIVRGIFTMRIWLLTRRNYLLVGVIAFASLSTFVFGIAFAISGFSIGTFANLHSISYLLYAAFASAVAADVSIAISLCVSLSKRRTGFKRTDSLLNVLMLYSINSGLLTSLCSIASLVTYAVWPTEFTFIAVFFSQSKLYTISLFASINNREHLREKIVASDDIPLSLPGRPTKFGRVHEQDDPTKTTPSQSVIVTIERMVEVDGR